MSTLASTLPHLTLGEPDFPNLVLKKFCGGDSFILALSWCNMMYSCVFFPVQDFLLELNCQRGFLTCGFVHKQLAGQALAH
jgi:hypothetical protein